MSDRTRHLKELVDAYHAKRHAINIYRSGVVQFFSEHPDLSVGHPPVVHSVRTRMKDPDHLRDKLERKLHVGRDIHVDNLFQEVTDFAGVRVLHLHQGQFPAIHAAIEKQVADGQWVLHEHPRAYSWDPDSRTFYEGLGLPVELKDSYYTSVHYVVRPRNDSPLSCEIQVRTLFEEIWGEIDHVMNYPHATHNLACKEQLSVLAKLVATGSRLGDAIFRVYELERQATITKE